MMKTRAICIYYEDTTEMVMYTDVRCVAFMAARW